RHLDADLVFQVHERLDLELEADVEVVHRLGDEAAGRRGRGGDHRHAVADVDARLLLVLHPDARIGEHAGGAVLLAQLEQEQRIGERELHQVGAAVQPLGERMVPAVPAAPTRLTASESGKRMPRSSSRLEPTSSTSTSSITSGSARSCAAISRSARRTAAGVSLITSRLSFSSMNRSRVFTSARTMLAVWRTSAFAM